MTLSPRQATYFWCRQWVRDSDLARRLPSETLDSLGLGDRADEPVGTLSYGLRLMDYSGFGLRERAPGAAMSVWAALHDSEPADLAALPFDRDAASEARRTLETHFETQTGRPLKVAEFREAMRAAARPEGAIAS